MFIVFVRERERVCVCERKSEGERKGESEMISNINSLNSEFLTPSRVKIQCSIDQNDCLRVFACHRRKLSSFLMLVFTWMILSCQD